MLSSFAPIPLAGWKARKDRFDTQRSRYNFQTLSFAGDSDTTEIIKPGNSSEPTAAISDKVSSLGDGDVVTRSRNSNIEPSQALIRKTLRNRESAADSTSEQTVDSRGIQELRELAIDKLSIVGRKEAEEQLKVFYNDPSVKMVTIVGSSGLGKSVLAQQLRKHVVATKSGVFCSGKFDVQNRADPYQAFVEAIGSFVSATLEDADWSDSIATLIHETIGGEIDILLELVPSMELLLSNDPTTYNTSSGDDSKDQEKDISQRGNTERAARIQNVLIEFIKLVSTKDHPMTILLDDIQWAGSASLGLIEAILEDDQIENFFLLATCRDKYLLKETGQVLTPFTDEVKRTKEAKAEEPYPQLIELLERYSALSKKMNLKPLDVESVQQMINDVLRMDGSTRTQKLAEIVQQKTAGNPFFILQFLNVLVDEELLSFNLGFMQWTWLEGDIQSQNVAVNVADAVYKRLRKLDPSDLFVLQVASAIGNSFEISVTHFVFDGLRATNREDFSDLVWPSDINWTLEKICGLGIIESQYGMGRYDFAHDQIQSAAFRLIPEDKKQSLQYSIGRRLIEGLDTFHRDQFLFPAVELCMAGVDLMSKKDALTFAFWLFAAGDTASKQGAFETALRFFDHAIEILGKSVFEEDEELAVPLYCGALEAAYALTEDDKMERYLLAIEAQTQIPLLNRFRAVSIRIKDLSRKRKYLEVGTFLCKVSRELGVAKVSPNTGLLPAFLELKKTHAIMKKMPLEDFLKIPMTTNREVSAWLQAITDGTAAMYLGNPALLIIMICKGLRASLKHGMSELSPAAMTGGGVLICGVLNDYATGCRVAEAALQVCNQYNLKKALPKVVGQHFAFVRHWQRPMQQFVAPCRYAMDVGLRMGQTDDVCMIRNMFCVLLLANASVRLPTAIVEMERYYKYVRHSKAEDQLYFIMVSLQFAYKLARPHESNTTLDGVIFREEEMYSRAKESRDPILVAFLDNYKVQLLIHFGTPHEAKKHCKQSAAMGFKYGQGTPFVPRFTFCSGIVYYHLFEQTKKRSYLRVARKMKDRLKHWTKAKNPNWLHLLMMLQAEDARVTKRSRTGEEEALKYLSQAAVTARRLGSSFDEAYANELRALLYNNSSYACHDKEQASYWMTESVKGYMRYGANTKVVHLRKLHRDLIDETDVLQMDFESALS